jgi:hypothetical protein
MNNNKTQFQLLLLVPSEKHELANEKQRQSVWFSLHACLELELALVAFSGTVVVHHLPYKLATIDSKSNN